MEERITGTRDELEAQAKQAVSSLEQQSTATAETLQEQAEAILEEVRGKRDEVVRLYGVIGDTGTAGAFAKEADNQKKAADRWRRVAIGAGVVTLLLAAGAVVFSALSSDTSLGSHLASLVVAGAAGGLTAYAARQSGHHRDREDESRRIELELTAFGPFTSELDEPDKARSAYAERLFKGADRVPGGEPTISRDQVTLLQTLIESVMKARG